MCEDNREVFAQEESLMDTPMKEFKSCIEFEICGHIGTTNLEDNSEDVVEVKDQDELEINYSSHVAENEECCTHPFGAHKEDDKAADEKYIYENGVSTDGKSVVDIFEEESAAILNGANKDKKENEIFSNNLFVSYCADTQEENNEDLACKSNIEGEVTASVAACSLKIPMMHVANDSYEEGANEATSISEIFHGEVMVNDDGTKTATSVLFEAISEAKKDKVHCVEVLEPVCEFFENIDDFNFVEEFDKIIEECIEVAATEAEGIYNDAENKKVVDLVIAEVVIEKELHNDSIQNVICFAADRAAEIENDVLDEELKFLKEWLEKSRYDDKYVSLVA